MQLIATYGSPGLTSELGQGSTAHNGEQETRRARQFTVVVLARRTQVSPHTILYYERRGLLPRGRRSAAGYRLFSSDSVRRIRFIKRAQALGFLLREIKELLTLEGQSGTTCADVHERVKAKVSDTDEQLRTLRAARRTLVGLAANCTSRRPLHECPVLQRLEQDSAP